jgi:solute carrier family 35 protein F5
MFFGLVGLLNVVLLWPGFFILHFTGIEPFALPPTGRVAAIIFANSLSSLVSDIAWAYAVLLTSPIVVTVGLSMTIPLSLIGQIVLNDQKASALYWVGAVAVVLSFVFVSEEEKEEEEGTVPVDEERLEQIA